ncbi:MAG TPA: penicillin-binding protein 2 [Streptosporangiaceae bacterium]|nr:penicillin-binding protein 2 [Streptosporangiaceae bacterium]
MRRAGPERRLRVALLCIVFALSIFAGRLVQVEGFDSAAYKTASAQWHPPDYIPLPAVRGAITTSDGAVLAMTVQTETVFADPKLIPVVNRPQVAARLAGPLKQAPAAILQLLNHPSSPEYVKLASGVSVGAGNQIAALDQPGIDMTPTYTTRYPNADLAATVSGFVNNKSTTLPGGAQQTTLYGVQGLEQEYNSLLAGRPGGEYVELGQDGQPIPNTEADVTPAVPARSLRLTIQSAIQYDADQVCRQRVQQTHASSCSIVVMQPKTGAILAMAQWPTYNPATVSSLAATTNIGVARVFAPGSTLKPVTVAAALEKGGQTPMSAYTIPPQITMDGKFTFHDAEAHPTERLTVAGILANSSNVGMVQVVQHITPQQQYDYLRAFGLGQASGLGLPGESAGLLAAPGAANYWGDSPFEYSFGQGLGVTAIQMASVYATIANGGVRVQPTLVAGTTSAAGQFLPAPRPASSRVISPTTASELMTILQQVPNVDARAGQNAGLISGYTVAAKTGTAQVAGPGRSNCLCQYGASYIGIAPADNPQLVVAVNIQDPQGNYYGDQVAGPAFYDVMKFALQTMKIAPDYARTPHIRLTAP